MRFGKTTIAVAIAAGAAMAAVPSSASWTGGHGHHVSAASISVSHLGGGILQHRAASAAQARALNPALAAGYCEVMNGPTNDAFPEVKGGGANMDSLDMIQIGAGSSGGNLLLQDTLVNAHSGPDGGPIVWGRTNVYGWEFIDPHNPKQTDVIRAEYPGKPDPANPTVKTVSVFYGSVSVLASAPVYGDVAVTVIAGWGTGAMKPGSDTLSVSIPLSAFKLVAGDRISVSNSYTLIGTGVPRWLNPNDSNVPPTGGTQLYADHGTASSNDFVVGKGCIAP